MYVPRLMPSMLRKKEANVTCTPMNNHMDQNKTLRTSCKGPNPLAAHFQATHAQPANPARKSDPPTNNPVSSLTRLPFALGFSLSEGILAEPEELLDLAVTRGERGVEIALRITARRAAGLQDRRRSLAGQGFGDLKLLRAEITLLNKMKGQAPNCLTWAVPMGGNRAACGLHQIR